jgi:hypothetical protein
MRNVENLIVLLKTQEGKQIILFFEKGKVQFENGKIKFTGTNSEKTLLREVI